MTKAAGKVRHDYTRRDLIPLVSEIQTCCRLIVYEAVYLRCELLLAVVRECRDNGAALTFMEKSPHAEFIGSGF
ncbi:unnamed protein product [Lathyrus sativus]|nr:unnamed protein product [Lathyrus sativus]